MRAQRAVQPCRRFVRPDSLAVSLQHASRNCLPVIDFFRRQIPSHGDLVSTFERPLARPSSASTELKATSADPLMSEDAFVLAFLNAPTSFAALCHQATPARRSGDCARGRPSRVSIPYVRPRRAFAPLTAAFCGSASAIWSARYLCFLLQWFEMLLSRTTLAILLSFSISPSMIDSPYP